MQVSADEHYWIGNDWDSVECHGSIGLVCLDSSGHIVYSSNERIEAGEYCAGLNVVSDSEVWLLNERLIKIVNGEIEAIYENLPATNSGDFAVSSPMVCWGPALVSTKYFVALNLLTGESKSFQALDESGNVHKYGLVAARGTKIYFADGYDLCVVDLASLSL